MSPAYGYTLAALIGAAGAWYVQGLRWDNDVQAADLVTATAISANVDAVNQQLIASRAQTEAIRATFIEYKAGKENETSALERAVADGTKRLRVKASCPTVRADGTIPGGAVSGTAELDASARSDYFELKRGLDRQYAELQFCRSELRKRSSQPAK
ncbi:Bacteriophage Rz lysis protein [compost metagenome]